MTLRIPMSPDPFPAWSSLLYRVMPAIWWQDWCRAWGEIGWHAQVDLRLNRRDATHRLPSAAW